MTQLQPEWQTHRLGDILDVQYGYPFVSSQFTEDTADMKLLRGDNVAPGRLRWAGVKRWPIESVPNVEQYLLVPGDIVVAMDRPVIGEGLRQAVVREVDLPCLLVQRVARMRAVDMIDQRFLTFVMSSQQFSDYIIAVQTGVNAPHISGSQITNFCVRLPSLPEQRRIVEILDEADAAVRLTEALIAANRRHKHAWAERLLTGQVRFPEFAGEAWQEATLGQFFRDRNARYTGDGPPTVLSCSKIYGIVPQTDLFSRVLASKDLRRYKLVEPGDLVFDPMLLWDASINFSARRGVVSPAYSTLQFVADEAEPRFFHYLFDSHTLRHIYKTISQGTNTRRKKATANDFLKIAVRIPRPPEQRKIAEVLGLMDEEIALRRRQLAALKAQKQGLMQKLLTGEVRVKETAP